MGVALMVFTGARAADAQSQMPAPAQAPAQAEPYRLGAGDKVRIDTYGEPQLSGEFTLDGQGRIAFPLLGQVSAAPLTIDELAAFIRTRLGETIVRDPRVTASILSYRPVYILGEVARPGEFAFSTDLSVYALVAKAGGFTYRANRRKVFVRHAGSPSEQAYPLTAATSVRPGDTIRIGERFL